MSWTPPVESQVGNVIVTTTSGGGRPPEWFAEEIVRRLMFVADSAPPPIRDQAFAFRDQMMTIVLAGIREAIETDRIYRK